MHLDLSSSTYQHVNMHMMHIDLLVEIPKIKCKLCNQGCVQGSSAECFGQLTKVRVKIYGRGNEIDRYNVQGLMAAHGWYLVTYLVRIGSMYGPCIIYDNT